MKKVISYALWGTNSLYLEGALCNARDSQIVYPGWIARFYHDASVTEDVLDALQAFEHVELVEMGETMGALGMFWRFHPMFDDDEIERFIVRDTDSIVTPREADAVAEWEESGKALHIIRDCESHNIPILGGTWGAKPGCVPMFAERMCAWLSMVQPDSNNPRGEFHGNDQIFLAHIVWHSLQHNQLAHIRAEHEDKLRFSPSDVLLPELEDGQKYVGQVGY